MQTERFGAGAHYMKKALEFAPKEQDAQKHLEFCYAKMLDTEWEGPNSVFPDVSKKYFDYEAMKNELIEVLKLQPASSLDKRDSAATTSKLDTKQALDLIRNRTVHHQSARYRDAVTFLEKRLKSDDSETTASEIHRALAISEMSKFGNRNDDNFNIEFVDKHLSQCKQIEDPVSLSTYDALSSYYRRTQQPEKFIAVYREMYEQYRGRFWYLYEALRAVNKVKESQTLLENACAELIKELRKTKDATTIVNNATLLSYVDFASLVQHVSNTDQMLELLELIKQKQGGMLSKEMEGARLSLLSRQMYERCQHEKVPLHEQLSIYDQTLAISYRDPHATVAMTLLLLENPDKREQLKVVYDVGKDVQPRGLVPWTYLEWALAHQNHQLFEQWLTKAASYPLPREMQTDEFLRIVDASRGLPLTQQGMKAWCRILKRAYKDGQKRHPPLFWLTRPKEKQELNRLLGLMLAGSGSKVEAIPYLESVLQFAPENQEVAAVLEDCREFKKNQRTRKRPPSKPL